MLMYSNNLLSKLLKMSFCISDEKLHPVYPKKKPVLSQSKPRCVRYIKNNHPATNGSLSDMNM